MAARVFAVGEVLAEFVATEVGGGHARAGLYEGPFPSGAPAIFIDQAARCGAEARMVGAVGRDGFGRAIRTRLEGDGVDLSALAEDERATGVAFVAYRPDGGRDFVFHIAGSAAFALPPAPEDPEAAMHVSGSSLGPPALREAILVAAERHLAAGGAISLDPNVRPELFADPEAERALRRLAGAARYLLPSLEDLARLHPGLSPEAAVDAMLAGGTAVVAVKRGAEGALVADAQGRVDLPGHAVEVADPTGAGDCFCGALVANLLLGADLETAARRANAAGALSVTKRGPMEGAATAAEIEDFLRERGA